MVEKVQFKSGDSFCAGDLFFPDGYIGRGRIPAVVIGHGFSFVKEALVDAAKHLTNAGYAALSIDYRTFGESGGEPRGRLFPLEQVEDFRNAISYLETRKEIDPERIGIWGTSFAGGIVIYTAAVDRRVKAVVAQVPIVNGRRWMQTLRTSEQWLGLMERLKEDRRRRFETGESARVAVTARINDEVSCAMPADEQIVSLVDMARTAYTTWRPEMTLESVERVIEFNPESVIHQIAPRPLCIVTTTGYDMIHPIEHILDAYEKAQEPKKIVLLPYDQLAFYMEPGLGVAMQYAVDWFKQYIPVEVEGNRKTGT